MTATVTPIETPSETVPVAAKPAAPSQPPVHVEPGSPASRFLAAPPVEPTIPTVAPRPAPAPQTVPDLAPPSPAPFETAARAEPIEKPAVKVKPAVKAKPARRTAAQRRADRRAAATRVARLRAERRATQRAGKRTAQAAQTEAARSRKGVAAVAHGKGVLSIASSPSLQVWVDGRNSRAMTPVRIILRPGRHKVTLIDAKAGTSRAFTVAIEDGETTRIVKNYR